MEQSIKPTNSPAILVQQGEIIIPVNFDNIAMISLKEGIVKLYIFDNKILIASESLEELERLLNSKFFRANRQCIVLQKAIKNVARYFNRRLVLHLHVSFDEQIVISKEKASAFLEWLITSYLWLMNAL